MDLGDAKKLLCDELEALEREDTLGAEDHKTARRTAATDYCRFETDRREQVRLLSAQRRGNRRRPDRAGPDRRSLSFRCERLIPISRAEASARRNAPQAAPRPSHQSRRLSLSE